MIPIALLLIFLGLTTGCASTLQVAGSQKFPTACLRHAILKRQRTKMVLPGLQPAPTRNHHKAGLS